jgi:hypothetical protein
VACGRQLCLDRWLPQRNIVSCNALLSDSWCLRARQQSEGAMATKQESGQIVETPTEARAGEPGPSVLALLAASTGLAILILGVVWFAFFRT